MFERFTDRARKVMALANQEAQRFNHDYIGAEHILLGLVKEGSGVGANVLKNLGINLKNAREKTEGLCQPGPADMVTMGKLMNNPQAKKVIEHAIGEARSLNHNYVGTEHLLLGLLREPDFVAGTVLINLGVDLEGARAEVLILLGSSDEDEVGFAPEQPVKMFLSFLKLREIDDQLAALRAQRNEQVANAMSEAVAETGRQITALLRQKTDVQNENFSREEVDLVLDLLKLLANEVPLGKLRSTLSQSRFRELQHLIDYLFPGVLDIKR